MWKKHDSKLGLLYATMEKCGFNESSRIILTLYCKSHAKVEVNGQLSNKHRKESKTRLPTIPTPHFPLHRTPCPIHKTKWTLGVNRTQKNCII